MDFLKPFVVAATIMSATMVHAGGPVIIEEGQGEEIAAKPVGSGGILPVIGALVLVCLLVCGGDDDPVKAPPK